MPHKFIITNDKNMADKLIAIGFSMLSDNGGLYTFLNNPLKNFNFESLDMKKICFTDKLCL